MKKNLNKCNSSMVSRPLQIDYRIVLSVIVLTRDLKPRNDLYF